MSDRQRGAVANGQLRRIVGDRANTDDARLHRLVRRSYTQPEAELLLTAQRYAIERMGSGQAERLGAARLLFRYHAQAAVVAAALSVPLRRSGGARYRELRFLLGEEPANLVERVLSERMQHRFLQQVSLDNERLPTWNREDRRLSILRLGLRMAELQEVTAQPDGNHDGIAQETLDLYVPLADQLGMGDLRTGLEDLSFRILDPLVFGELARAVEPIHREDAVCLQVLKEGMQRLLKQHGIDAVVYGRTKGLYSMYQKMSRQLCSVQDVMDKIGLRVIVSSVAQCYAALDLVHAHFQPVPGTFDDYIARPKSNGYRALHTCVYPVPGVSFKPVEIQIRTAWMHEQARFGMAAHWRYKSEQAGNVHDEHIETISSLLSRTQKSVDYAEFIRLLHHHVREAEFSLPG